MRIVIFILLKIAEIAAFVFVPYGTGYVLIWWGGKTASIAFIWFVGLVVLWSFFLFCLLLVGLYGFNQANWKWAKQIIERFKGE